MSRVMKRADHFDVIRAIEPAVADNLGLLIPVAKAWQPTDYLPDLEAENWRDQVERFRQAAETISDELLVVLVGDMVTEEALPSYSMALNGLVRDEGIVSLAEFIDAPGPDGVAVTVETDDRGDIHPAVYVRRRGRVDADARLAGDPLLDFSGAEQRAQLKSLATGVLP